MCCIWIHMFSEKDLKMREFKDIKSKDIVMIREI